MCELKDIKIVNLKKKCEALQIKTYGTKLVILDRIKKHYLQNGLKNTIVIICLSSLLMNK